MCELTAATLLYTSLALSAASTATSLVGQKQQQVAQERQQRSLVAANNAESQLQLGQLRTQQAQSRESAALEGEKARLASQKAKATATVAAGEAGVSGHSVDAVLAEYSANLSRFKEGSLRQRQLEDSAYADRAVAIQSGARYQNLQINAPVAGPNYAAGLLNFGSQALGAYTAYNPGAFKKGP